jgi:hypothetical protein
MCYPSCVAANPAGVVDWFAQRPATTLYLSVLTLGEIRKGIDPLLDDERKLKLLDWLEVELPAFFSSRILPIDAAVADLGTFDRAGGTSPSGHR